MNQTASLAEMVNSTNFAVMNYQELTELNFAITWASGVIKPLMKAKRAEEMAFYTKAYVDTMNGYCATRSEIMDCLNNEDMKETSIFSPESNVDVQPSPIVPTEDKDNHQEKKEILLLPEHISADSSVAEEIPSQDESVPAEPQTTESIKEEKTGQQLVEMALYKAKRLRIPEYIDSDAPYFVCWTFSIGENGSLGDYSRDVRNMDRDSIKEYLSVEEKFATLFRKATAKKMDDNFFAYLDPVKNKIKVCMSKIPVKRAKSKRWIEKEKRINEFRLSIMQEAIDKAKNHPSFVGRDTDKPSFMRFTEKVKKGSIRSIDECSIEYGDVDTLKTIKSSIEKHAKYFYSEDFATILSTDDSFAVYAFIEDIIYVGLLNIPTTGENKKKSHAKVKDKSKKLSKTENMDCSNIEGMKEDSIYPMKQEADDQSLPVVPAENEDNHQESDPATLDNESIKKESISNPDELNLVEMAVEMSKTLPVPDDININAPYFINRSFKIDENGKLGDPSTSGKNMDLDSIKEYLGIEEKYATVYLNATTVKSGDNNFAYMTPKKNITVCESHIPSETTDYIDIVSADYSGEHPSCSEKTENELTEKKRRSLVKSALNKAKKVFPSLERDMDKPSFTRFTTSCSKTTIKDLHDAPSNYGDVNSLKEIKTAIEEHAKYLYNENELEIYSTEDAFVIWPWKFSTMYIGLINNPNKKTENNNVKKESSTKEKKVSKKKTSVKKSAVSAVKIKKEKKTPKTPESIKGTKKDPRCQSITLTNIETGEKRTWESFRDCDKDLGASYGTTSQVAKGKMKNIKGWKLCEGEE